MKNILSSTIFLILVICSYAKKLQTEVEPWDEGKWCPGIGACKFQIRNRNTGELVSDKVWCESWKDKKWGTKPYNCELIWGPRTRTHFCTCKIAPLTSVTCLPSPPGSCKDCCSQAKTSRDLECCIYHDKQPCNAEAGKGKVRWSWDKCILN